MNSGVGHRWRRAVLVVAMLFVVLLPGIPAAADAGGGAPQSYVGAPFADGLRVSPTTYSHQSKMWFHDNAWWALMLEPAALTLRVFELRPDHTWRPTRAVIATNPADTGDALSEGDVVFVLSRRTDEVLQFARLGYDPAAREYDLTSPPVTVTNRGSAGPATIAKDSTGLLWATYATNKEIQVSYSNSDGNAWIEPFDLPAPEALVSGREVSAVVAFNRSIGVIWSDQADGAYRFAVHADGAPPGEWRGETALAGPGVIDNQVNVKVVRDEAGDRLVAAVKSAPVNPDARADTPLNLVLVRAPDGRWSSGTAGTVGDNHNGAILQVDETNRMLYFLAEAGGVVQQKQTPLDALTFGSGRGAPLLRLEDATYADVAGSKQPINARTGLVAMSSIAVTRTYHHAELGIPGDPPPPEVPDEEPPTAPGGLLASASGPAVVSMYWSQADDGVHWTAAADRTPVARYTVFRDGVEVGTTTQTSFADTPPPGARTLEYAVVAVDQAGNMSAPAMTSVAVPADQVAVAPLVGWSLLGGGGVLAAMVGLTRWRTSRGRRTS